MEYRVLGSLEVRSAGRPAALGPPKQQAILAILLLHAGEIVPTDRLIELTWGEHPPRTAAHSVQIYISELRKVLERGEAGRVILTRPPGYVLAVDPESIDARRFERLVAEGTRGLEAGDSAAAADLIGEALELWRGPPLSDFAYDEFAQDEIRRLEGLRIDALEQLAAAELARGRERAALSAIDIAIADDPLRERARELQMLALCRAGRHPEALRAYQQYRARLREELDIDPGPAIEQLHERVLLHDRTLAAPAARGLAAAPARNPYKGLRAFAEEDAGDFFGRETLVAQIVTAMARGIRLIALVGPSGSGKSSVLHAGLLPALRTGALPGSEDWLIARMVPSRQPFEDLDAALRRAVATGVARDSPLTVDDGDHGLLQAAERSLAGRRLLLVIDQFEELFSFSDEPVRSRFLRDVATAVSDPGGRVSVALAIRGDFYDRPLLEPEFGAVFIGGVVNVLPMTADGLESAIVGPARRVGVEVDPSLLARLVADTAAHPGALPLLQYTLTELFDRRTDTMLRLDDYESMGGLPGLLSRRAEWVFGRFDELRRHVVLQVFLRLVRLGDGTTHSRRSVPLRELTSLELDPVALSDVLQEFGRQRLLSFDRDPAGGATVEVAHEALLWEWQRLAAWIEDQRSDLRQHASFAAAANEWEASGHHPDYLPIGGRLAEYEAWSATTALQLTTRERDFLGAGRERHRAEEAEETARRRHERQLERRARSRLRAMLGSIALLAAGITFGVLMWVGSGPPDVALLFEGTGDAGFGDMAAVGFERAVSEFDLRATTQTVSSGSREVETELRRLSAAGVDLVVVGLGAGSMAETAAVALEYPGTRYIAWENEGSRPNLTNVRFRSEEASYLAGVAAATRSRTGVIGFIGAWPVAIIDEFLAGYEAGARSVDGDVEVRSAYLADWGDPSSGTSGRLAQRAARQLYGEGADVVFVVAAEASWGVFEVASSESERLGRQLWAIGADTDAYDSVLFSPAAITAGADPTSWQPHILTSVTKRLDRALYATLADYAAGGLAPGTRSFGLEEGGVDLAYSGHFLDDIRHELDTVKSRIISGEIEVPTIPAKTVPTGAP